jgi:Protein of unknown function (DUF3551)
MSNAPRLTQRAARRRGLTLAIVIAAALDCAAGRAEGRWCASAQGPDGGFVSCSYSSWQQCQAALSGQGGICYRSPR